MNKKVKQGLEICYKTANILKEKYPSEIMKIQNDTILPFSKENIKRKKFLAGKKSMGLSYAFYTNYKPHRIIIKQKILKNPSILRTKIKNQKDRTKGHAKGFKIKYKKFLLYMINSIISGYFYYE